MRTATKIKVLIALGIALVVGATHGQMASKKFVEGVVSTDGSIRVPQDFRTEYVMLGTRKVLRYCPKD
jgi:hypothetical protein